MLDRSLLLLLLAALAAGGCDGFKRFDTSAGLLTKFNVDAIKRDGRQLIRMHSQAARVRIDPVGSRVLAFQRHRRPGAFLRSNDHNDSPSSTVAPNPLDAGPWRLDIQVDGQPLKASRDWMVDAGMIRLVLLADAQLGLRVRRAFTLYDNGVLDVEVSLLNTTFRPLEIDAASVLPDAGVVKKEGYTRHRRYGEQWLSRRLMEGPAELGGTFRLSGHHLPALERVRWVERWWITPIGPDGEPESPAAEPPPIPKLPWKRDATDPQPPRAAADTPPENDAPAQTQAEPEPRAEKTRVQPPARQAE